MKILVDTCIVIDVLQKRDPFCNAAMELFLAVSNRMVTGVLTAKSITDIHYILHRSIHNKTETQKAVQTLFSALPALKTGIRTPFKSVTAAKVPKPPISTSPPSSNAIITALTGRYALVLLMPLAFATAFTNSYLFIAAPPKIFFKFPAVKSYVPPASFADTLLRTVSDIISQHPMHLNQVQREKSVQNFPHR